LAYIPFGNGDTRTLIAEFIDEGFKTAVVCVDPKQLDPWFLGRVVDKDFLSQLPAGVDPCGENGEFHTFVFDGPMFRYRIKIRFGERICRDSFWFCDLVPGQQGWVARVDGARESGRLQLF
jgi:diphthamide synthase (EF-2-diphthine--ammonia ligase)